MTMYRNQSKQVMKLRLPHYGTNSADRNIFNHKPDIVTRDSKEGTCTLIDVANPGDTNVVKKGAEKILKHKDLITEIQRVWDVKARVTSILIGTTGTISKSLRQYPSNVPGEHKIKELQQTAIFGTAHKLLEMLM